MKNLIIYYLAIFLPIIAFVLLGRADLISSGLFVFVLFFYVFVYRTVTDNYRLYKKGVITYKEAKQFRFFRTIKYFNELYWL